MPVLSTVTRAHISLLIYALLITTSFPLAHYLGGQYPPLLTTWLRFLLASLGFMLVLGWRRQLAWPGWPAVLRYGLISLPLTGFFLLMFIAGQSATALAMGSLATLVPLFSAALAWLVWRTPVPLVRWLALLLGALGALWVLTQGEWQRLGQGGWPIGNTLFLAACLLMSSYPLVLKQLHRGEPMLQVTSWSLFTGTALLTLAMLVTGSQWFWPTPMQWSAIAWLATGSTMLTFFLFQSAALVVGASSAHAYSLLIPALVVLLNSILLQTWPGWQPLPGILLTVLALVWLLYQDRQA
ncbi:DMT family transporter [Ferrimonas balearica]|uniref:DMT family transporter n=1 Tax=Ferrimonas balearica TaxID=44012 RepID=UPI001F2FE93E|nr:DMT family transporter [Ferrimonas balearica]MBY6019897.1 DMT family transporter [Halomonas denitrificans]MBY6097014.1 DMT family transporter [Ferrimonas balearica]